MFVKFGLQQLGITSHILSYTLPHSSHHQLMQSSKMPFSYIPNSYSLATFMASGSSIIKTKKSLIISTLPSRQLFDIMQTCYRQSERHQWLPGLKEIGGFW